MVVILPKNHPSAHLPFVSSEIFGQYPVLSYDRSSGLGKYTHSFFNKHHILPEFICESPDENGIASLVAEGFGIALVADVESIHRDDIIIKPLIPAETFSHTVYMGYLRDHYQLPAVKRLIDFIKSGQPD